MHSSCSGTLNCRHQFRRAHHAQRVRRALHFAEAVCRVRIRTGTCAFAVAHASQYRNPLYAQNTTDIRLPRDPMALLEFPECNIELGCTYDVRIESNHPADVRTLSYTVPGECDRFCFRTGCQFMHRYLFAIHFGHL